VNPRLTLSYGVRWEYYPSPTRPNRGLERYDFNTNESILCGLGSTPKDCGLSQSKKLFSPRVGIAWRSTNSFIVRAGYGITYDPFSLGRDLRANYPIQFVQNLAFDTTLSYSTTLDKGLPPSPAVAEKERLPLPLTAAFITADGNFKRGYVQSWNLTLEKQVGNWVGSAGYVATRSIRQTAFLDANWSDLGKGNAGQQLVPHLIALEDFCRQLPALRARRQVIQSRRTRSDPLVLRLHVVVELLTEVAGSDPALAGLPRRGGGMRRQPGPRCAPWPSTTRLPRASRRARAGACRAWRATWCRHRDCRLRTRRAFVQRTSRPRGDDADGRA
jgi:hypothetical protein